LCFSPVVCAKLADRNSGVVIRDVGVDDQAREFGGNLVRSIGDETRPPKPLHPLQLETKGQAGTCPDPTRAIPCTVRAVV
jgi:hypothetical protein